MSKKEVVLLVSRALAVIQFVTALLEITYLPERLLSLHHHESLLASAGISDVEMYFRSYDQLLIGLLFARIACLLVLALVFWNCSPWFERLLLPKRETPDNPAGAENSQPS
jgi:hypothetical protein